MSHSTERHDRRAYWAQGACVALAALCVVSTAAGQNTGVIHWVAIRSAYQGRGLGKAAMSFALNQLARWHEHAILGTQTKRLRAIGMYLDFGFLPELDDPGFIDVWREVNQQIKHPVLDRVLAEAGIPQDGEKDGQ